MKNNEEWRIFNDKEKEKIITECKMEFWRYRNYLTLEFFSNELDIFENLYDYTNPLAPDISFKIFIKRRVLKRLSDFVNAGDIDLEIELIEEYTPLINKLLNKLGFSDEIFNVETILEKALLTYDSNNFFSIHILKTIKSFNNSLKNIEVKADNEEFVNSIDAEKVTTSENEDKKIINNADLKSKNTDKFKNITANNSILKNREDRENERNDIMSKINKPIPTILNTEEYNSTNNAINDSNNYKNKDEISKNEYIKILEIFNTPEFIEITKEKPLMECLILSLKLGYIDGKYFSDDAIASFLDINVNVVKETFKNCLVEYREYLNEMVDKVISNNWDFADTTGENTKNYYPKKLEK